MFENDAGVDGAARATELGLVSPEVLQLLTSGRKIPAIKRYRELTGASLTEAVKTIDLAQKRLGLPPPANAGASFGQLLTVAGASVALTAVLLHAFSACR